MKMRIVKKVLRREREDIYPAYRNNTYYTAVERIQKWRQRVGDNRAWFFRRLGRWDYRRPWEQFGWANS